MSRVPRILVQCVAVDLKKALEFFFSFPRAAAYSHIVQYTLKLNEPTGNAKRQLTYKIMIQQYNVDVGCKLNISCRTE